ncbi:hypothetical protein SCP_1201760 [Sparassis crispa]|uniref:F-box domain-containing protein n=1 Tax=Sparassis crispa TaxID=139825 RepID=A0A401H0N3_9APHY|nr:hypothetical protein SCP_1201760 [Sparassis crispa]GBE87950.1 hypothetical protein SCP_1201760 [Sparassis crispa]
MARIENDQEIAIRLPTRAGKFVTARRCINDLPLDVLITIFKMVYFNSRKIGHYVRKLAEDSDVEWEDPDEGIPTDWHKDDDLFSPSLFPEALAAVCPLWREAMNCVSVFWTRLVIIVGQHPTPLSEISSYLTFSRKHPIDIIITHRPQDVNSSDTSGEVRVAEIMELLLPHIGRWRKLHINVALESSLPSRISDLRGNASALTSLRLESSSPRTTRMDRILRLVEDFQTPALQELVSDGYVFRDAYLSSPKSLASITTLTISHFSAWNFVGDSKLFFVSELVVCLHRLQNLTDLRLVDLVLDDFMTVSRLPQNASLDIESVRFEGMHGSNLSNFYYVANRPRFTYLTFGRYTLPHRISMGGCMELNLSDLSPDSDIHALLQDWDGDCDNALSVSNCSSFDGRVLLQLSVAANGEWLCPRMTSLDVEDCPLFNSGDLQRMVQARREEHAKSGFADEGDPNFTIPSIEHLSVSHSGDLTSEDKAWFDKNVKYVTWDEWTGGYEYGQFTGRRRQ